MATATAPAHAALKAESLAGFPIFSMLEQDSLAALAAIGQKRRWAAGSLIFQRGDAGDFLLAITEGKVRLSLATAQGRELVLRQMGPGEIVGEFALIDGQPRSADAVAVEAATALVLHRDRFLEIAAHRPDVGMALARHLCAMLRDTNFQMESIALYDLQMRLIRFILFTLRQIYGAAIPDEPVFSLDLNQSDLSAVLGASRPKVNQALQVLIADGALRRDGKTMICKLHRLEQLTETHDASTGF